MQTQNTKTEIEPVFFKVKEAAAKLNIGVSLAWHMVNSGQMPHRRFGRNVRIPVSWVREQAEVTR